LDYLSAFTRYHVNDSLAVLLSNVVIINACQLRNGRRS
jgi:hypothetical protein